MNTERESTKMEESVSFEPYDLIKEIESLGLFKFDPEEDEISSSKMKFEMIKMKIENLLKLFKEKNINGEYNTWSEYLDAKAYLEGRFHSVDYVLEQINGIGR